MYNMYELSKTFNFAIVFNTPNRNTFINETFK